MSSIALNITSFAVKSVRFCLNQLMRLDRHLHANINKQAHDQSVVRSTQRYDMVKAADEIYYAEQYWLRMATILQQENIRPNAQVLDLGCGQGRISIPLAKWCRSHGSVTAVDLSAPAIEQAKQYAKAADVSVQFHQSDLFAFLKTVPNHSYDVVTLLEVVFFLPDYQQALKEILRVLKPGGLLIASFRSQYFNVLYSLQHGMITAVNELLEHRSGAFMGGNTQFNWHTLSELQTLFTQELHCEVKHVSGIGICSGIPGDPHASIIRPSSLSKHDRQMLMQAENQLAEQIPEAGRYILIAARAATKE